MKRLQTFSNLILACLLLATSFLFAEDPPLPDYAANVAPIFTKYCAGCHNDSDREGEFSLESYASLQQGTPHGPALLPGDAANSRLIRSVTGAAEPSMPPEGEPRPNDEEITTLKAWIDAGAIGPQGAKPDRLALIVPKIPSQVKVQPITALDASPDGQWLAVARYATVELFDMGRIGNQTDVGPIANPSRVLAGFPGKVTSIHFTPESARLITASGVAGLGGVAAIWNVADGALIRQFDGHRDILYDAELAPDGITLATCGYDKTIQLWDASDGKLLRTLEGHNGAIYDVAFSPDGNFLVSASADDTCKVWRVADGLRMDTLPQPLKEEYCCAFSPDGRFIVAGGADNNVRVWKFVSRDKPRINPMVRAQFAHEGPIVRLAFTPDGSRLISLAEDRTVKVWNAADFSELQLWENEPDVAMALAVSSDGKSFHVGRMDGSLASYSIPAAREVRNPPPADAPTASNAKEQTETVNKLAEQEPNNSPSEATAVKLPAEISGAIVGRIANPSAEHEGRIGNPSYEEADCDLFRFSAKAGEQWVIEVNAARSQSKLDAFVEVLDSDGRRIERVVLQAVRDSYFTFRGKDDSTVDDFRIFNWQEMSLNDYLYANGEVVKLWLYPRGADSGYLVYPGQGKRWGYFDTTPLSHALGEPCYIVQPQPPGTQLIPNGLPVFPLYFENDDDAHRELGKDSRLTFTAPADGQYLVKIKDVRGYEGADFKYTLTIRPRRPDFRVTLQGANPTVGAGSAKEIKVTAQRSDGFDGPIRVEIKGLPPGFSVTLPIVIEAGQIEALGVIAAAAAAPQPTAENAKSSQITATATIGDGEISHDVNNLGEIKLGAPPKVRVTIVPADGGAQPISDSPGSPLEIEIHPGETILLKVRVERNGYDGEVALGKEDAGRNLPFGAFVDNIGLNGLLILAKQTERTFFITADPSLLTQTRYFHLNTSADGGQASQPVLLHVRP